MDDPRTSTASHAINALQTAQDRVAADLERLGALHRSYREGRIHVHVPAALESADGPLDDLVQEYLPTSKAALEAASKSLFYSLPVAFDPAHSIGPFLATVDRDAEGQPYRFLDMGALIATQAFGENDPAVVEAVLNHLPYAFSRYAHSEYQTAVSLQLKAELNSIAPAGTPRHFVVNTGAEAVENAIKSVLLNRVKTTGDPNGGFIISFEGAFHGRTLGSLAVTHRKKARLGFPTFDWPQVSFPVLDDKPKETARREEKSLKQVWDLLVSGRLPHAEKSKETFRRELDAIDAFLATPGQDATAFVLAQRAALSADTIRRSRRVAAVLVEPIQGEGGVRFTSPGFMRRLRLLTGIYDVPLMFDEVQTGWGATGRMWAHELFELPMPPDIVVWAKKAQNGVLFVSEELATFFQEEKKFNTTWEGEAVGMVRLLATLHRIDLEQVRRTGERARRGLETLAARLYRADSGRAGCWCDARVRRGTRRLAGCAARPRLPARPRAPAGRGSGAEVLSALRHRAVRDRRGALDPENCSGRHREWARGAVDNGTEYPRRGAGVPARGDRRARNHRSELPGTQSPDHGRRGRALRRVEAVSARCPARRRAAAAPVAFRGARNDALERPGRRRGAARRRQRPHRGLRARKRTRGSRRRRGRIGSLLWREQHVLPAGDGHAAVGAEPGGDREQAARVDPRPGSRGRLRIHLDTHRGARSPNRPGMAARGAGDPT